MLFYSEAISENGVILDSNDSRHAVKALRLSEGDSINVTDGHGRKMLCTISKADARHCIAEIVESTDVPRRLEYLHVAIAPTKNMDRLETFIEKATEIGVEEITPIICDHSERNVVKLDRMSRIAVSAMKQSGKTWLPRINDQMKFSDFLKKHADLGGKREEMEDMSGLTKCIAYCGEDDERNDLRDVLNGKSKLMMLIGPEGDFSPAEIELALSSGFDPVSLGTSRLRTETAGIVAVTLFNFNA